MHYVYILYSPAINRFYIGESADPDEQGHFICRALKEALSNSFAK